MNTTLQIRIDKKTKEGARKVLAKSGLDLSSGVKYFLSEISNGSSLANATSYVCEYGYQHRYTPEIAKKYKNEIVWALKHGKRYTSTKEMFDALEK